MHSYEILPSLIKSLQKLSKKNKALYEQVNTSTDLKKVRDEILVRASEHYEKYKNLGFEEHKRIWIWQLCYQMKSLFDLAGVDWRPSKEMLERVEGKQLVETISQYNIPFEEFCEKFGINYLKMAYA